MASNDGSGYLTNLLDGAETDGNGTPATMAFVNIRGMYGVCQCSGFGTATVTVRGRVTSNHAWKTITQFTADDAVEVVLFPEMQAVVSGYSSGTYYVDILGKVRQ